MNAAKRILIVEDDAKVAKVMGIRLKAAGYEVLTAEDGVQGLQLAEKEKPDLIITDIWMPVGVGFALAYRLKQMASEIPIIFMSASKDPGLRRHAVDFGAVAFLEKPYTPELLLELVACAFNSSHSTKPLAPTAIAVIAPPARGEHAPPRKILVVEDDRKIALALATRLRGAGFETTIAPDAITGVNLAVKIQPDLIVLDISMPAGNGFDVAERVQSLVPKLVPIIFLTASKQAGLRERAVELGAGFFEKPYNSDELLNAIYVALGETVSPLAENIVAMV